WVYCSEDPVEAKATAWRYMGNYWDSAGRHYGFATPDAFKNVSGYEHYQHIAEHQAQLDPADVYAAFAETQVYGTPAECVEKLTRIHELTNASEFIGVFRYGGLPADKAEASMRLFARDALPALHALQAEKLTTQ